MKAETVKDRFAVILQSDYRIRIAAALPESTATEQLYRMSKNSIDGAESGRNYLVVDVYDNLIDAKARAFDVSKDIELIRRMMRHNRGQQRERGMWFDLDGNWQSAPLGTLHKHREEVEAHDADLVEQGMIDKWQAYDANPEKQK